MSRGDGPAAVRPTGADRGHGQLLPAAARSRWAAGSAVSPAVARAVTARALAARAPVRPSSIAMAGVPYAAVWVFCLAGEERPLPAEASLAAYRTAQEALTNARKHAPGRPVQLSLGFEPEEINVCVVNPLPPGGALGDLAVTGGGYGLTGLRERAALVGGALEAGPADGNWRVRLGIPA